MRQTGFPFEVMPADYEEDMTLPLAPEELVMHLSRGKAMAVAHEHPDAIVIGGDSIVTQDGKVFGKPHTPERALEMLRELNGHTHRIVTGLTVIDTGAKRSVSESSELVVYFNTLTEEQLSAYVDTGEPLDRAEAYAIQGIGRQLVARYEGDYEGAVGLSVDLLTPILKAFTTAETRP